MKTSVFLGMLALLTTGTCMAQVSKEAGAKVGMGLMPIYPDLELVNGCYQISDVAPSHQWYTYTYKVCAEDKSEPLKKYEPSSREKDGSYVPSSLEKLTSTYPNVQIAEAVNPPQRFDEATKEVNRFLNALCQISKQKHSARVPICTQEFNIPVAIQKLDISPSADQLPLPVFDEQ